MLARNSTGRRVSLLNDDSNITTSSKRSNPTSILPSISTFYNNNNQKSDSAHQLPLRSYQQSISSGSASSTNDPFSRKSSFAAATSSSSSSSPSTNSPIHSAVAGDYSPALSQKSLIESSSAEPTASVSSNGRNSRTLYSPDSGYSRNHQQPTAVVASAAAASAVHQSSSSSHQRQSTNSGVSTIPHRPAGPTPLLLKRPTNSTVYSRGNSSSSTTTTTSSSKGSSSYSHSTSNSSNSTNSLYSLSSLSSNQSAKSHHSLSSSSSASRSSYNTTPLTPPTPVHSESNRHLLDPMDTHKSSAYGSTVLSSPTSTRDPFLYPAGLTGNAYPLLNGYNLSVAQQPLPPPITASSPVMMYSTIDSPTSATSLMDPYLQQQQQQIPTIPFAPYPNELIPGAIPPTSTQSVAATSPSDTSNNSAPKTAKKKYPCPHAAKYNCSDTFTTSGHAARHGKKHTGEKNIHCPVCDKAFTRKDNMKQHERTHRNKGEASKVAQDVETSKRAQALSKTTTNSSTEVEMEDSPPVVKTNSDPQTAVRAAQQQRRPQISPAQQAPPSLTSPTAADIPMPVTLDSGETLQRVAPSFKVESMNNIFDNSFTSRSQENILGRPAIFERTTSTGSGFSADGEGESPGLDALAMAAELS